MRVRKRKRIVGSSSMIQVLITNGPALHYEWGEIVFYDRGPCIIQIRFIQLKQLK